jgi:hypothetical protein
MQIWRDAINMFIIHCRSTDILVEMAPKNCKRRIPETTSIHWVVYIVLVTTCLIIIVIDSCSREELHPASFSLENTLDPNIVVPTNVAEPPQSVKRAVANDAVTKSGNKPDTLNYHSRKTPNFFRKRGSVTKIRPVKNGASKYVAKAVRESHLKVAEPDPKEDIISVTETRSVENNLSNSLKDEAKVVTKSGNKPDRNNYQSSKTPHLFRKRGSVTKTRPVKNGASKYVAKAVRESHLKVAERDPKQDIISDLKLGVEIFGPVMNSSVEAVSEPIFGTKLDMEHFAHDIESKTELKV